MRRLGIEEELFVVADDGRLVPDAELVLTAHRQLGLPGDLDRELFSQQIELRTAAHQDSDALRRDLIAQRTAAIAAARVVGRRLAAVPTDVRGGADPQVTPEERYLRMAERFGAVARDGLVCGMHVHVEVAEHEAVPVIDALRPWTPLLAALAANSPFSGGRDTGCASWRGQVRDAWPTAGAVEPYGDLAAYRRAVRAVLASGAALDEGMIYQDARVCVRHPTVEIRVADVCTDLDDALLTAELTRALVEVCAQGDPAPRAWRVDLLRAARWRARSTGLAGDLLDPLSGTFTTAAKALESLLTVVSPALPDGTSERLRAGVERLLRDGGGAARQRQVAGPTIDLRAAMADIVARTGRLTRRRRTPS